MHKKNGHIIVPVSYSWFAIGTEVPIGMVDQ